MKLGFHTISLLLHDELSAINELAKIGYSIVAVRPRLSGLDPANPRFGEHIRQFSQAAKQLGLTIVLDLDGQFVHHPAVRFGPSLVAQDRSEANDAQAWIEKWIPIAAEMEFALVTFSSGRHAANDSDEAVLENLTERLCQIVKQARASDVQLALRPRFKHAVATVTEFERLQHWLSGTDAEPLLLAADVGEMLLGQELPIGARLSQCSNCLACVYLRNQTLSESDLVGQVDLKMVTNSLKNEFDGPAIIELCGQGENGLQLASEMRKSLLH